MVKWLLPVGVALVVGLGLMAASRQGIPKTVHPLTVPAGATAVDPTLADSPCTGKAHTGATYQHVIWIVMGTRSSNSVLDPSNTATNVRRYASQCGIARFYSSAAHPALPNVQALVTGSTIGLSSNRCPCPTHPDNLFKQVPSWKVYVGGMRAACSTNPNTRYNPDTNSPVWIGVPVNQCRARDVPLGLTSHGALASDLKSGNLPRFAMVIPSVCTSMTYSKSCVGKQPISTYVAAGDQWLGPELDQIVRSTAYRSGQTAVFVTWLTGEGPPNKANCAVAPYRGYRSCQVTTLVIAPSVPTSTVVTLPLSHYSLLRTTETLLGIKRHLGLAEKAPDMRAPFHL